MCPGGGMGKVLPSVRGVLTIILEIGCFFNGPLQAVADCSSCVLGYRCALCHHNPPGRSSL